MVLFLRLLKPRAAPLVREILNTIAWPRSSRAFPPAKAARLKARFEFHSTPKHGSSTNIVEIEFSVLAHGCLARRIPELPTLAGEWHAWQHHAIKPPSNPLAVHHRYVRTKPFKLYPSLRKWQTTRYI